MILLDVKSHSLRRIKSFQGDDHNGVQYGQEDQDDHVRMTFLDDEHDNSDQDDTNFPRCFYLIRRMGTLKVLAAPAQEQDIESGSEAKVEEGAT